MPKPAEDLHYQLESYRPGRKGSTHTCPGCDRRKQFTRYVDVRTNELIPEEYGICNKVNSCGYHLGPYHKGPSGMCYADVVYEQFKADNPLPDARAPRQPSRRARTLSIPATPPVIHEIPRTLVDRSLGRYEQNQLAILLQGQFGPMVAGELLRRFQIGTSLHWPGACIFWYIDEQDRVRGGQIKLLGPDGHTVKYVDGKGNRRSKMNWVHSVKQSRLEKAGEPLPDWLQTYLLHGKKSPCLFGLPQLRTAPPDQPIAIVEAPKTAIIATACYPDFVWLATGSKDQLTADRLAPLRHRYLTLYPDADAYQDIKNQQGKTLQGWLSKAAELRKKGFHLEVSDILEYHATDQQKKQGLDLADFLLTAEPDNVPDPKTVVVDEGPLIVKTLADWAANPGSILSPDIDQLTYL